jgi:salicylate hydroxylase
MTDQPTPAPRDSDDTVLIAGAGIGGLAAALALARTGRPVLVLERRAENPEEGAGIQIGPNGTRILRELGVAAELQDQIAVPNAIRVMDGVGGRELSALPLGKSIEAKFGAPYWVLHRADLHAGLRRAVARDGRITVLNSRSVCGAQSEPAGVTVELADGSSIRGAALIGADGLWSSVRSIVSAAPPLVFTGKCAMRAVIPAESAPARISCSDTTIWLRPSAHVVHYPVRQGHELAIVAIFDDAALGETWAEAVDMATVTRRAQSFPPVLRTLLSKPRQWRQWSLYTPSASTPWVRDRIALLGDAAHPPLPFLAQGGVMALEDAVVLAGLLDGAHNSDIPARLAVYERQRRPRTTRVMEASAQNGRVYHLDGLMRLARDAVLRTSPAALLMSRYDWLYGWRREI